MWERPGPRQLTKSGAGNGLDAASITQSVDPLINSGWVAALSPAAASFKRTRAAVSFRKCAETLHAFVGSASQAALLLEESAPRDLEERKHPQPSVFRREQPGSRAAEGRPGFWV
ncbi:hypothetical protein AAFF_G00180870 [Aldrovandia affinis]|uniref:Uncharacterized protein n=1 Tax=Aldrovandia affinis TaxID=143900 RepID=A0AAD7SZM1_9TELE|nr:hypothetical protein AAFF_G00180870 [Aldrovandia affinis]